MNDSSSVNDAQAEKKRPEKALWYQEVLSLDPASRIFLPYARLLAENGRRMEAVEVLRAGLERHPEFLDARLLLIDLLHASGQDAAAGREAAGIIESLSRCSSLWKIWSTLPGVRADQAAMLLFFGATFRKDGPSLADVFEAGMKALRDGEHAAPLHAEPHGDTPLHEDEHACASLCSADDVPLPFADEAPFAPQRAAIPSEQRQDAPADSQNASQGDARDVAPAEKKPCFVMQDDTPWYSLDSVPDDDDLDDPDEENGGDKSPVLPPSVSDLFFADKAASDEEGAAHAVPRAPLEGKSSLCTRSMARILEEQGATVEAADIYRELLEVSSSPEEKAELNAKLDSLRQGTENAVPGQAASSGIMDMLETLAVRLENKSRA